MKISLAYPKIPDGFNCPLNNCWAYEKYDGTNMHFVCNKDGWHSFGTRRNRFSLDSTGIDEFNNDHPGLEEAPIIFNRVYKDVIQFQNFNINDEFIIFMEFLGDNSFAGTHQKSDKKKLIIIDAMMNNKLLTQESFVNNFLHYQHPDPIIDDEYHIAELLYSGKYNWKFLNDVRTGKFGVNEGVVCKGMLKDGQVYMTKIKTNAYLEKLKAAFQDKWEDYWE